MRSTRFRLHVGMEGEAGKGNSGRRSGRREREWLCVLGGRFGRVRASAIPPFGARAAVCSFRSFSNVHPSHIFNILCKIRLPATNHGEDVMYSHNRAPVE